MARVREAQDIYAFLVAFYAVIYFLCVGHINMFVRTEFEKSRSRTASVEQKHVEMTNENADEISYDLDRKLEAVKS